MRRQYIERLRIMAALAVVMIHITMTEVVNFSIEEIGRCNYAVYSIGYALSRWAVPVFIMITGSLLLNPEKSVTTEKIKNYMRRMIIVLVLFGTVFAAMELVVQDGLSDWVLILPKALLKVAQNKSWDHLWYLYLLIGLYFLTPFTRAAVKSLEGKQLFLLIVVIYTVNYVRPAINIAFDIQISNFWIAANGYFGYYLLGYYLTVEDNYIEKHKRILYFGALVSMIIMIGVDTYSIVVNGAYCKWIRDANPLVPIIATAIYVYVKQTDKKRELSVLGRSLASCSFGIYLVHPFFINLLYKFVGFKPTSLFIGLGIPLLYGIVLVLSWCATLVMKKIPYLNELI